MYNRLNISRKLNLIFRRYFHNNWFTYKFYRFANWYLRKRFSKMPLEDYVNFYLDEDLVGIDEINPCFVLSFGIFAYPSFFVFHFISGLLINLFPMWLSDLIIAVINFNPLVLLCMTPLAAAVVLAILPPSFGVAVKHVSFYFTILSFITSIYLLINMDLSSDDFQYQFKLFDNYFSDFFVGVSQHTYFSLAVGIDTLSCTLIVLNCFLFVVCSLFSWRSVTFLVKENNICFHLLSSFIIIAFSATDLVLFYVFFEATLIPLFIIIGIWGARERKIYAAYKLFFYTLASSVLTLIGFVILLDSTGFSEITALSCLGFSLRFQDLVWFLVFLSFAVKLPMFPLHLWLPEAHVEASTAGSIILAGILLKLGGYGFFRFLLPFFPSASNYYKPLVVILSLFAIIFSAIVALRQTDLKKIIAYSSVSHMGLITLSLFSMNDLAYLGAAYTLISHGFTSGFLFALIGVMYDRYHTKLIFYYKGLTTVMPMFAICFFLGVLANISLPGSIAFNGELMIFYGILKNNLFSFLLSVTSIFFGLLYSIWLFNRIFFGEVSTKYIKIYSDLNEIEFFGFFTLIILIILFGVYPRLITDCLIFFINDLCFYLFKL